MYFITSTVNHWIKLFQRSDLAAIILESLSYRVAKGEIRLNAYVLMPNHLHMIVSMDESGSLRNFLRDFHKFTAREIINALNRERNPVLTRFVVQERDRNTHFWRKTHSPKQITTWKFFLQKIEYIHNNPLSSHWRLCERPEHYPYSSACDYLVEQRGAVPLEVIKPSTPW
ncbi:MAG: transposase [Nitrospinae bacterium]|nr:transposase [Nitrospinota bacterium]